MLGVDNDEVLCRLTSPPLSSIDPNFEQIGYQAAALLDRMMKGRVPPASRILVPALYLGGWVLCQAGLGRQEHLARHRGVAGGDLEALTIEFQFGADR